MRRWIAVLGVAAVAGCAGRGERAHVADASALGPYSSVVDSGGFVFVSGKIGTLGGTFEEEARSAIGKVGGALRERGLELGDLVSVTVYLRDMGEYAEFNRIYAEMLPEPYPARAVVEVSRLPKDARVEIQGIARR